MKLAYLVSRFPQQYQTFVRREINELVRLGHEVTIFPIASAPSPLRRQPDREDGVDASVVYTPFVRVSAIVRALTRSPATCFRLAGALVADTWYRPAVMVKSLLAFTRSLGIAHIIASGGYEHIHAHWASYPATAALAVSSLTGIPFSFAFHAYDLFHTRILLRRKANAASFVVLNSTCSVDYLQGLLPDVDRKKLILLYNGLELERFKAQMANRSPDTQCPLVLGVGRLVATKGFHYLVDACRLLADEGRAFRLVLIGAGREASKLRSLIAEHRLTGRVELVGECSEAEVSAYLAQATVLAAPSLDPASGSHDVLPNVILEAQASGVPVVATGVFAIPEVVVHERTGLLVPPRDAEALKHAIARLVDEGGFALDLAARARENLAQNFNVHTNVVRLAGLFEKSKRSCVT